MRKKLKDCQDVRVRNYQHCKDYLEGDKVWFEPLNGNAWIGPALVVAQRGQSVYLQTHSDLKKIAACRVKPYELVNTDGNTHNTKEVMKEDGLEDIDNMYTTQLNEYYYNKKHSNNQNSTNTHTDTVEENTHNVKYTATLKNNLFRNENNTEAHINTVEEDLHNNTDTDDNNKTQNNTEKHMH